MSSFEPEVVSLAEVAHAAFRDWNGDESLSLWHATVHAVIAEYSRQQTEVGIIEVSTDLFDKYQDAYMEQQGWHRHGPKHWASYPTTEQDR